MTVFVNINFIVLCLVNSVLMNENQLIGTNHEDESFVLDDPGVGVSNKGMDDGREKHALNTSGTNHKDEDFVIDVPDFGVSNNESSDGYHKHALNASGTSHEDEGFVLKVPDFIMTNNETHHLSEKHALTVSSSASTISVPTNLISFTIQTVGHIASGAESLQKDHDDTIAYDFNKVINTLFNQSENLKIRQDNDVNYFVFNETDSDYPDLLRPYTITNFSNEADYVRYDAYGEYNLIREGRSVIYNSVLNNDTFEFPNEPNYARYDADKEYNLIKEGKSVITNSVELLLNNNTSDANYIDKDLFLNANNFSAPNDKKQNVKKKDTMKVSNSTRTMTLNPLMNLWKNIKNGATSAKLNRNLSNNNSNPSNKSLNFNTTNKILIHANDFLNGPDYARYDADEEYNFIKEGKSVITNSVEVLLNNNTSDTNPKDKDFFMVATDFSVPNDKTQNVKKKDTMKASNNTRAMSLNPLMNLWKKIKNAAASAKLDRNIILITSNTSNKSTNFTTVNKMLINANDINHAIKDIDDATNFSQTRDINEKYTLIASRDSSTVSSAINKISFTVKTVKRKASGAKMAHKLKHDNRIKSDLNSMSFNSYDNLNPELYAGINYDIPYNADIDYIGLQRSNIPPYYDDWVDYARYDADKDYYLIRDNRPRTISEELSLNNNMSGKRVSVSTMTQPKRQPKKRPSKIFKKVQYDHTRRVPNFVVTL